MVVTITGRPLASSFRAALLLSGGTSIINRTRVWLKGEYCRKEEADQIKEDSF